MDKKNIISVTSLMLIFIYSFSIIPVSNSAQNNLSLIGYWPFDKNANDYSGNSLNGTPNGVTFTHNNQGMVGESAIFSYNAMGGDQGINLPLSSKLFFSNSTSFIITVWIKTQSTNSMMIFSQ